MNESVDRLQRIAECAREIIIADLWNGAFVDERSRRDRSDDERRVYSGIFRFLNGTPKQFQSGPPDTLISQLAWMYGAVHSDDEFRLLEQPPTGGLRPREALPQHEYLLIEQALRQRVLRHPTLCDLGSLYDVELDELIDQSVRQRRSATLQLDRLMHDEPSLQPYLDKEAFNAAEPLRTLPTIFAAAYRQLDRQAHISSDAASTDTRRSLLDLLSHRRNRVSPQSFESHLVLRAIDCLAVRGWYEACHLQIFGAHKTLHELRQGAARRVQLRFGLTDDAAKQLSSAMRHFETSARARHLPLPSLHVQSRDGLLGIQRLLGDSYVDALSDFRQEYLQGVISNQSTAPIEDLVAGVLQRAEPQALRFVHRPTDGLGLMG